MKKNYESLAFDTKEPTTFLTNPLISTLYLQVKTTLSAALQGEAVSREDRAEHANDVIDGDQIEKDLHKAKERYQDKPFSGMTTLMLLQGLASTAFKMASSDKGVDAAIEKFDMFEQKLFNNIMEMFSIKCDYKDFQTFMVELCKIAEIQQDVPDVATMIKIVETHKLDVPSSLLSLFSVDDDMAREASKDFVMMHFETFVSSLTGGHVEIRHIDEDGGPLDEDINRLEKGGLKLVKPGHNHIN